MSSLCWAGLIIRIWESAGKKHARRQINKQCVFIRWRISLTHTAVASAHYMHRQYYIYAMRATPLSGSAIDTCRAAWCEYTSECYIVKVWHSISADDVTSRCIVWFSDWKMNAPRWAPNCITITDLYFCRVEEKMSILNPLVQVSWARQRWRWVIMYIHTITISFCVRLVSLRCGPRGRCSRWLGGNPWVLFSSLYTHITLIFRWFSAKTVTHFLCCSQPRIGNNASLVVSCQEL
jgi:hypothetical protein